MTCSMHTLQSTQPRKRRLQTRSRPTTRRSSAPSAPSRPRQGRVLPRYVHTHTRSPHGVYTHIRSPTRYIHTHTVPTRYILTHTHGPHMVCTHTHTHPSSTSSLPPPLFLRLAPRHAADRAHRGLYQYCPQHLLYNWRVAGLCSVKLNIIITQSPALIRNCPPS